MNHQLARPVRGRSSSDENLKLKSPPYRGVPIEVRRQDKMRLASRLVPPPHAAHLPRRLHPALRSRCAPCSCSFLYDYAKKVHKLGTQQRGGGFYRDEIKIKESHSNHRKLDSHATLSHRARDRAADGAPSSRYGHPLTAPVTRVCKSAARRGSRRAGWMAGRPIGLPLLVPLALARAIPASTRSQRPADRAPACRSFGHSC